MDKTVRMWDIREPQAPLATLEVLSGSRDTSLKVWSDYDDDDVDGDDDVMMM